MTKIQLPYGHSHVDFEMPGNYSHRVLNEKNVPGLPNEKGAILESLKNPLGCPALGESIKETDKVVIITTDNTRPCPDDRILPVILEVLTEIIPRDNITIIVGLGLHAPLDTGELVKKFGKNVVDEYNVINHYPARCVKIGETSRGVPVEINRVAVEADFRISTGFIEPHFFAGFSGGRKSIMPAISSVDAIRRNHSYRMLDHPRARAGILENNPVHEDMVEQARIARLDFIVNVILNAGGEITHVFSGAPGAAHGAGCRADEEITRVTVDDPFDITVTTNGGAPLDLDFYQACKGIDTAAQITREGGVIIMAASCYQGTGSDEFMKLHTSYKEPEEILTRLNRDKSYAEGVSWQNQILARIQQSHRIFLLSGLDDATVRSVMMQPVHSIEDGLTGAISILGEESSIAVIPRGPLVLPALKQK
ncbi:MAG: nickel-dependent lactate racemase [Dehalococcoidia bacterium]|jgi:nickel-dependent lactate racemase